MCPFAKQIIDLNDELIQKDLLKRLIKLPEKL